MSDPMTESGVTVASDSERYSAAAMSTSGEGTSPGDSSSSPAIILYNPPSMLAVAKGVAVNMVLPFINGMMMGFGELWAHEAAFRLGWSNTRVFPESRRLNPSVATGIDMAEPRRNKTEL